MWVLLTAGIVVNGLRLRDRLARLLTVRSEPGDPTDHDFGVVTAKGVTVDDAILDAVVAHARRNGLQVIDLVPTDLGVEAVLDVARLVDTAAYRSGPLLPGRGARQAIAADRELLARAGLDDATDLDPVEMVVAAARLKQFAPRATDLVAVEGLHAAAEESEHRLALLRAMAGPAAIPVATLPILEYAVIAAGLLVSPGWALAAAAAATVQPLLATAGTAFAGSPRPDPLTRCWRLPADAVRALRSRWQSKVVVSADPRAVEVRRPIYEALLAQGTDHFFEEPRTTCPWCGATEIAPRFTTPDLTQGKPGRFTLDGCTRCGHVFQNPRLSIEGLDFYYRDFYDGLGADNLDMAFSVLEKVYRGRAETVAAATTPTRWLDVGGGHGHFALIAAEVLPDTTFDMIDQSDAVLDAVRRGWVDRGFQGLFTELAADPSSGLAGSYDVVSMHHYLEHTRDPRAEIAAARTSLVEGGHLLIEVPDPESSWSRRVGRYWGPWLQPQHQHFVPIGNLCAELEAQGFVVVGQEHGPTHQPIDFSSFVGTLAQDLAPPADRPWSPRPTPAQRAARLAILTAAAAPLAVAYGADLALSPVLSDRPGGSNTYRVLARRT